MQFRSTNICLFLNLSSVKSLHACWYPITVCLPFHIAPGVPRHRPCSVSSPLGCLPVNTCTRRKCVDTKHQVCVPSHEGCSTVIFPTDEIQFFLGPHNESSALGIFGMGLTIMVPNLSLTDGSFKY